MTKLRILAAIVALGAAAPAFASEGTPSTPNQAHLFVQQDGQAARLIEGRNSDRAAAPQAFEWVDRSNLSNGSNR